MKLRKQLSGTAFKIINEKIQYERFKWGLVIYFIYNIRTLTHVCYTIQKGNIDISKRARKHALDVNEERQHVNPNETRTANNLSPPVKTKCLNR
uniref:Uncharacterized protein n=1 Tax=Wuchereria bancrofti TaxID=6293 RepID=A0AAF5Q4T3_WUCBA